MKKLFVLVCVMLSVRSATSQSTQSIVFNETLLINETFDSLDESTSYALNSVDLYVNSTTYCTGVSSIESPNPIDGSQYLNLGSNSMGFPTGMGINDCATDVVFSPIDLTPYDLVKISFECSYNANTSWELNSAIGALGPYWFDTQWNMLFNYWSGGVPEQVTWVASPMGNGWYQYVTYLSTPQYLNDNSFDLRLFVHDNSPGGPNTTSFNLDNFVVAGYVIGGEVTTEPVSQGCAYDIDGSGTIGTADLLEFLMWYGADVECN